MRPGSTGDSSARNVIARPAQSHPRTGRFAVVLGLFQLALAGPLSAATFPDLYTVTVLPDPAATNVRADAERRAMSVLLTRITGRRDPASYPEMGGLLRSPRDYLASYTPTANGIRVGFSRSDVNAALTRQELPLWGAERPATLLWITFDMGGGEYVELMAGPNPQAGIAGAVGGVPSIELSPLARQQFDLLVQDLLTAADERGLPIVLPGIDLEDRRAARFADVWGGFETYVAGRAESYAVDAILIGRVTVGGGTVIVPEAESAILPETGPLPIPAPLTETELAVAPDAGASIPGADVLGPPELLELPELLEMPAAEIHWTLLRGERRQARITPEPGAGIDWLADEFAAQYVTIGGASLSWITVHGIASGPDFNRVDEYLRSVSIIDMVDAEVIHADGSVRFRIAARGDSDSLRQTLTLDGRLRPWRDPASDTRSGNFGSAGNGGIGGSTANGNPGSLDFIPSWLAGPELRP